MAGLRSLFVLPAMTALALPGFAQDDIEIPFEEFGQQLLSEHFGKGARADEHSLEDLVAKRYATVSLGLFNLGYPVDLLGEKQASSDYAELATGLLDLQDRWIEWLTADDGSGAEARADCAALRAWVADWDKKALAKIARAEERDLFRFFTAPAQVIEAQTRLDAFLHDVEHLGLAPKPDEQVDILFSPTRLDFIEMLGLAGLHAPQQQEVLWDVSADQWTQFWSGWTLVAALEYGPWTGFDAEFRSGKSMKSWESTGMVEQVILQSTMTLLRHCMTRDLDHFENALAMNLVIEVIGQINTVDGEGQIGRSGAKTQPYKRFVPGGASEGGRLPPKSAAPYNMVVKNQWREGNGADYFLKPLRKGQKDGAKRASKAKKNDRARDKTANFTLISVEGKYVVSAPFLGVHADEQEYPPFEYLNDYGELFRAYKSAFYNWLRVKGTVEGEAPAQWARVLRALPEVDFESRPFEAILAEIYGLPLSAANGETDSLEWRFLAYIKKGK